MVLYGDQLVPWFSDLVMSRGELTPTGARVPGADIGDAAAP